MTEAEELELLELENENAIASGQSNPQPSVMEGVSSAFKQFVPQTVSPIEMAKEMSIYPTQSKAGAGLSALNAATFGLAKKGLRSVSPTLPEPTRTQEVIGSTAALAEPITGAVIGGIGKIGNIAKATFKETPYLEKISGLIRKPFEKAGQDLGKAIDEIDLAEKQNKYFRKGISGEAERKLSLTNTIDRINELSIDNPAVASAVRRSPTLKKLIENPELAQDVSARVSQDIVNELKGTTSLQNKMSGISKTQPIDQDVLDIIGIIRKDQLAAYPELSKAFKNYGKVATDYWKIKKLVRPETATGFIMGKTSGIGNAPLKDAVKRISPQAYKLIKDYRTSKSLPEFLRQAGYATGAGAGAALAIKAIKD